MKIRALKVVNTLELTAECMLPYKSSSNRDVLIVLPHPQASLIITGKMKFNMHDVDFAVLLVLIGKYSNVNTAIDAKLV